MDAQNKIKTSFAAADEWFVGLVKRERVLVVSWCEAACVGHAVEWDGPKRFGGRM